MFYKFVTAVDRLVLSLVVETRNQGKSGTMVSLVGPGRSYQGFLGKSGPTRVLSYQGLFLLPGFLVGRRPTPDCPTRVSGRPQADARVNEMQTIVLKQPERKMVIITYTM